MPSPVAPGFVKVYVKKRLVFDRLTFPQRDMFRLGTAGLVAVKKRVRAAQNLADAPANAATLQELDTDQEGQGPAARAGPLGHRDGGHLALQETETPSEVRWAHAR